MRGYAPKLPATMVLLSVFLLGCPPERRDPFDPNDDTPPPAGPLSVIFEWPSQGATGTSPNTVIEARFSAELNPVTVTSSTFQVSGGVTGALTVDGAKAMLTPSSPLSLSTAYTVTLTTGIRDRQGRALSSAHSWSFTTTAPPPAAMPLAVGKAWRYERADTNVIWALSTGRSVARFRGERFMYVAQELTWQGRPAWRLLMYDFNDTPSGNNPQFTVSTEYVAQNASGLERWVGPTTGWRRILSTQLTTFTNGTFLMAGGPSQGTNVEMQTASVTVPAGSYTALRALHDSRERGQFAPVHWDERRTEDYAPGVGLIRAGWSYHLDPKDPQAADIWSGGTMLLTHVDGGPSFPVFLAEAEPNDGPAQANRLRTPRSLVEGVGSHVDPGIILTDAEVGCTQTCLHPNVDGVKRFQDWYQLDLTAATAIRIELAFESAAGFQNDFDLYLFQAQSGGSIRYVAAATDEPGRPEWLAGTLPAGTYYIAIQAWRTVQTPRYWLSVR